MVWLLMNLCFFCSLVGCRGLGVRRKRSMEGVFGFREMMGEEFMGMFLPFFGKMVQKVVMIFIQPTSIYYLSFREW